MPLNIPMPELPGRALLRGLDTGSTLFSRYMQPIIQREQLAEQGNYHQGTLAQQQRNLEQQQQQFLQELALRKQAEARMSANAGLERQIANLRMQKLNMDINPEKKLAYINQIMSGLGGQELNPQQQQQIALGLMGVKIPVSPQQKLQNDINKSIAIDEAKTTHKETKDIEETARNVMEAAGHLEALEKLFTENPNRTGMIAGRFSNAPLLKNFFDAQTIKEINAHAVPLQGQIAAQLSKRGGYGVAKIAESAKPSATDTQEGNLGSIKANKEAVLNSLNLMKSEYERLNPGKKFPYKIPEFLSKDLGKKTQQINNKTSAKRLKFNADTGRLE